MIKFDIVNGQVTNLEHLEVFLIFIHFLNFELKTES